MDENEPTIECCAELDSIDAGFINDEKQRARLFAQKD